jgi:hypothetical protein
LIAVSCLFLLDDAFWIRLVPRAKEHLERLAGNKYRGFSKLSYSILLSSVFIVTTIHMSFSFLPRSESPSFLGLFSSFGLVNDYALDVASGEWRTELHVEGSRDDRTWKAYSFRFKPERSKALSPILFSHHPRLDWQMAYAVRSVDRPPEWISRFCNRLLEGSPSVVDLMENNPFKDLTPRAVRIYRYDLELSDFAHRDEGAWIEPFHSRDLLLQCTKS